MTLISEDVCVVTDHPLSQIILYKPRPEGEDFNPSAITLPSGAVEDDPASVCGLCLEANDLVKLTLRNAGGEMIKATGQQVSNGDSRSGKRTEPEMKVRARGNVELVLVDSRGLIEYIEEIRGELLSIGIIPLKHCSDVDAGAPRLLISEGGLVKIGERLQGLRLFSECNTGEEYRAQTVVTPSGKLRFPNNTQEESGLITRGPLDYMLTDDRQYIVGFSPHDGVVVYLFDKPNGVLKQRGEADIDLNDL